MAILITVVVVLSLAAAGLLWAVFSSARGADADENEWTIEDILEREA